MSGLVGSTIGEFGVLRRRKKQSAAATEIYQAGGTARISGCVYGLTPLSPNTWAGGEFDIAPGVVTWFPGNAGKHAGTVIRAEAFTPISIRQVKTRESWAVLPGCICVRGAVGKQAIEMSVLEDDVVLLLDSLRATRLLD
jgi:hypothetical protein